MIITADFHLRAIPPRCRQEKWYETQKYFLSALASNKVDTCIVGDIFNSANETSPEIVLLMQKFARALYPKRLFILAGNHDLPFHTSLEKSPISILLRSNNIYHISKLKIGNYKISAPNFGEDIDDTADIIFLHQLVCAPGEAFPGGIPVEELDALFPKAKYVFLGDNHHAFNYKNKIYNPGTPIRQTIDLINYTPQIIRWDGVGTPILTPFEFDFPQYLKEPVAPAMESLKTVLDMPQQQGFDFETILEQEILGLPKSQQRLIRELMQ